MMTGDLWRGSDGGPKEGWKGKEGGRKRQRKEKLVKGRSEG